MRKWLRRDEVAEVYTLSAVTTAGGAGGTSDKRPAADDDDCDQRRHRILNDYADVFDTKLTRPAPQRRVQFEVELDDAARPAPVARNYRLGPAKEKALQDIVNEMAASGIIEPTSAPPSCPIFLVKKKTPPGEPQRWRAVLDARPRNRQTVPRPFRAPHVQDTLAKLARAEMLTSLDLVQGFFQIPTSEETKKLFVFADAKGQRWQTASMVMGATNSMAILADAVAESFADFIERNELCCYADDWVLQSTSGGAQEHERLLRRFLDRCRSEKWILHRDKTAMFQREVPFLGYMVGNGKCAPLADRVGRLRDWPTPRNSTETRAFLGAAGYYRHLIKDLAVLQAPLDELTGKGEFSWTDDAQQAFEAIRERLVALPEMYLPDLSADTPHFFLICTCLPCSSSPGARRSLDQLAAFGCLGGGRVGRLRGD